jgi:hypothetical protein
MNCSFCNQIIKGITRFIHQQGKIEYHFCSIICMRKFSENREIER